MLCDFLSIERQERTSPVFTENNCCTTCNANHLEESPIQILKLSFEDILKEYFYFQRKLLNAFISKQESDHIPVQVEYLPLEWMVQNCCRPEKEIALNTVGRTC